ncbi:MAG TPA: alpha/beta fold hydrolase [Kiritimatiellia bacterium]|nr:alpha/beta fold hydrolase [Kiritimatiellia bacterium]HSA19134.1 alpha/beta fold hydrolase [Kiritimatiellia bacterium]
MNNKLCFPVIVVPGITATYLRDEYEMPPETVWAMLRKSYDRVSLHPDNLLYEAKEPARVVTDQVIDLGYKQIVHELRHNLRDKADEPVPVFCFGYDWRQPLDMVEKQLDAFITEVIDRTKLLPHYHATHYPDDPKVHLVGHSMGGLIITGYLERKKREARVAKVATLATPFRGSFEAVLQVTTGTASLGTQAPSSSAREMARAAPAVYHLIPRFEGMEFDAGLPDTLFDPAIWQPSVVRTLGEYVRLYAAEQPVDEAVIKQKASDLFSGMLAEAKKHRDRIEAFRLDQAGLTPQDWLCVVGVGSKTRVALKIRKTSSGPEFDLASTERKDNWGSNKTKAWHLTGDGTVPFKGAQPAFLKPENLVCVTPKDYGYWEVQDNVIANIAGFHGIMPNMNMLHRLIVRHFTGREDKHGNTWGRRAPGVGKRNWKPPMELEEKKK